MSNAGPALRRPNTSALYAPLSQPPAIDGVTAIEVATDGAEAMFIHVIGAQVFIDDRPAEDGWTRHVVGVVDDVVWWAVDVPHDAVDPSYGAAIDLFGYYGRASEAEWFAAGRAVQLVEWGRTHRFCGRCGTRCTAGCVARPAGSWRSRVSRRR